MVLNLSQRQLNNYAVNLVLLAVVVLSWVYAILAGKFISERHLSLLDFSEDKELIESGASESRNTNYENDIIS